MQLEEISAIASLDAELKNWIRQQPLATTFPIEERTRYVIFLTDIGLRLRSAGKDFGIQEIIRYACKPIGTPIGDNYKIHSQYEDIAMKMLPVAISYLWGSKETNKANQYDSIL